MNSKLNSSVCMFSINSVSANYSGIKFFEIRSIFIFLTIYFVFIPFLLTDITVSTTIALSYALLGCISFFIGYKTKAHFSVRVARLKASKLLITLAIFFALIDFIFGISSLLGDFSSQDYTERFVVTNFESLYVQIPVLIFFTIKYFYFSIAISRNKFIFYLIFLSQVFLSIGSPTRLVVLQPFIIFIVFGCYYGYIKLTYFKIGLVLISSPFLFLLLLLARGTGGESYFDVIRKAYYNININADFNQISVALESFRSFEDFVSIVGSNFVHFESGIIRIFLMPIIRSMWAEKPESISRIISKEFNPTQYDSGGGTVALIFGDAFINSHIIGIIFLLFVLGFISRIIFNTMRCGLLLGHYQKGFLIMTYSVFVYDFLFFYRGFFSEFYWRTIIFLLFSTLLYKLFFVHKIISR